jgi:hypothetical protein
MRLAKLKKPNITGFCSYVESRPEMMMMVVVVVIIIIIMGQRIKGATLGGDFWESMERRRYWTNMVVKEYKIQG